MSAHPVAYVGSAMEAAGFALAGIETFVACRGEEAAAFARARDTSRVVLIAAECAAALPATTLEAALAAATPITVIVPGADGARLPQDPVERARRMMGLET